MITRFAERREVSDVRHTHDPSLRSPLASEIIRDEFGKIANEFLLLPEPLAGGIRGFAGGQWDNGILNAPRVLRGILGTNVQPCSLVSDYVVVAASAFTTLGTGNVGFARGIDGKLKLYDGARVKFFVDNAHNLVMGFGETENALNESTGFFYLNSVNGTATGAPQAYTGAVPMAYDRALNKIGVYNGGAWKWTAALA